VRNARDALVAKLTAEFGAGIAQEDDGAGWLTAHEAAGLWWHAEGSRGIAL
jgi:hypothetical protein